MRLIKKIEVNYYRSLYRATLNNVGDLNVVFGRNDSGKSNLLRALNLFFNGKTDAEQYFEFALDMSDMRKHEAREAKGRQFLWIKVTFNVPENYHRSLGKVISVKKQWNRDGAVTETHYSHVTSVNRSRLTRFLNDIDFTYIPAVKAIEVYSDLIERLYGATTQTNALQNATRDFISAISGATSDLTTKLTNRHGVPARIRPPTVMKRLFRSLDFAHGDEGHSLLRQKGDGIKARYLPEILRFINENEARTRFYLWGFEEPENSLDLGAATVEAQRFAEFAARKDIQVFITSHSPAFYLAEAENAHVRRFFISKQVKSEDGKIAPPNAVEEIDKLDDAEHSMQHAGLLQLPFVIRKMEEQKAEIDARSAEAEELRSVLSDLQSPALFVEGRHDVEIFLAALGRLGYADRIIVRSLGKAHNTVHGLMKALLNQGMVIPAERIMFLYDNDKSGRKAAKVLVKDSILKVPKILTDRASVWVLPMDEAFLDFLRRYGIENDCAFFTAEFLFPAENAAQLCRELIDEYDGSGDVEKWSRGTHEDYYKCLNQTKYRQLVSAEVGTPAWFYARGVPDFLKGVFARRAMESDWSTTDIDAVINVVVETLLS